MRWPRAHVTGIDFSNASIAETAELKRKHDLHNLELHELPVERAADLGRTFDYIICTGVLHHLPDPESGLRALSHVLAPDGAMHLMLYAPYGRAGIGTCCRLLPPSSCRRSSDEIRQLAESLGALLANHPLGPLLRNAPDFATEAGLAECLVASAGPLRTRSRSSSSFWPRRDCRSLDGCVRLRTCRVAVRSPKRPTTRSS